MDLITVVEDHVLHARLLRIALYEALPGSDVEWLRDGLAAARRLADPSARLPHLLVLDLEVPGRSGHDLLALRAGDARLQAVPAVVVTASRAPGTRERSLALGATAHVAKPGDVDGYRALAGRLASLL
jgi:CheY-like chemotaxis protein